MCRSPDGIPEKRERAVAPTGMVNDDKDRQCGPSNVWSPQHTLLGLPSLPDTLVLLLNNFSIHHCLQVFPIVLNPSHVMQRASAANTLHQIHVLQLLGARRVQA